MGSISRAHSDDGAKERGNLTPRPKILDLFEEVKNEGRPLHVCAPMVRYSKLPFRLLLHSYNVDVTYTPMILAHEFVRAQIARDSDFTTHPCEQGDGKRPALIAQFASSDVEDFARAAELIAPWVDGVNLNCGCPQSWAIKEGIGCSLMESPDLVVGMVTAARERVGPSKSISVKIRIHKDLDQTRRWVKTVEQAGIDYITIHGRTRSQRSSTPPNYAAIKELRAGTSVPVVANGDAYNLVDVQRIAALTSADGVMAARGMLENPAMFTGVITTPAECVGKFVAWAARCPIPFPLVLHHISEMTTRMPGRSKKEKKTLMECRDMVDLIDYVDSQWRPGPDSSNSDPG